VGRQIESDDELQDLRKQRRGLIFNRFGKVLHEARCDHTASMTTRTEKVFYDDYLEAKRDFDARFGENNWNHCPDCSPRSVRRGAVEAPTRVTPPPAAQAARSSESTAFRVEGPSAERRAVWAWSHRYLPGATGTCPTTA
jgi:hypothetical protein